MTSGLHALSLVLLVLACSASTETTLTATKTKNQQTDLSTDNVSTQESSRLQMLRQISDQLHKQASDCSKNNLSLQSFQESLDSIFHQAPSLAPLSAEETYVVNDIVKDKGYVISEIAYLKLFRNIRYIEACGEQQKVDQAICFSATGRIMAWERRDVNVFPYDNGVQSNFQFKLQMILDSLDPEVPIALVIYPSTASPLRPLPNKKFLHLPEYQILEMVTNTTKLITQFVDKIGRTENSRVRDRNVVYFDMSDRFSCFVKSACAIWSSLRDEWVTDDCVVFTNATGPVTYSQCYCFVSDLPNFESTGPKTTEFIFYRYQEDIDETVDVKTTVQSVKMSESDVQAYLIQMSDIAEESLISPNLYREYFFRLGSVIVSSSDIISKEVAGKVVEDIGKILTQVQPEPERNTIGLRYDSIISFVIALDGYKLSPPIGFGICANYLCGIVFIRAENKTDYDYICAQVFKFSLVFSNSVVQHNSRIAFFLFPSDKFFYSTSVIDGHKVLEMRVVDILLVSNDESDQNQLIHLFLGKILGTDNLVGCAFWSPSSENWTSDNCQPTPDLHDGVCTCNMTDNFAGSPTRGQYIVYRYKTEKNRTDLVKGNKKMFDHRSISFAKFMVHQFAKFPKQVDLKKLLYYLTKISNSYGFSTNSRQQVVQDSRLVVPKIHHKYNAVPTNIAELIIVYSTFHTKPATTNKMEITTGFTCNMLKRNLITYLQSDKNSDTSQVFSNSSLFGLLVSNNIPTLNKKYAFIVYPVDSTLFAIPHVLGFKVDSFRVVDVILEPDDSLEDTTEQHVVYYFDHPSHMEVGCAFWSDKLWDWTVQGCKVVRVNAVNVCNCSLTANFTEARFGGQYVVYSYTTAVFDDHVYEEIGANETTAEMILKSGAELLKNGSQLLKDSDTELSKKILQTYHKILARNGEVFLDKLVRKSILEDLETAFSRFYVDPDVPVSFIYAIRTSWTLKSSEIVSDLYSNAVLSSNTFAKESLDLSDFTLAVIGHQDLNVTLNAFELPRQKSLSGNFSHVENIPALIQSNPQFACVVDRNELLHHYRFIFTVYPMNMSPYPYTMTTFPVFNSRQIDIYVDVINFRPRKNVASLQPGNTTVHVYFQPDDRPKDYIKIGCASWDDDNDRWTEDLCTLDISYTQNVSCICNITNRSVTRIIMYEYTDLINFSLMKNFEGNQVIFLISSSFSLLGFLIIVFTAILFPAWRDELSNKIFIQLSTSSFLYLCMTMIRETHLIYVALKRLDLALVAFTVCVHYTRLVHYCWALAMSVLQYRRFSSVVGASSTSHLLLKTSLFAWGAPLCPLVALLTWDQRTHFCSPDKLTHYVLYVAPLTIINLINLGLLAAIIYNMSNGCGRWDDDELKKHGGSEKNVFKQQFKQAVMMFFLFGIPSIFEMFNDIAGHIVAMDYIYKILNPIQGFVLFLYFVLMNGKTRRLWNENVFGDVPSAVNPPKAKKMIFKLKTPKKMSTKPKRPADIAVTADSKPSGISEPEIQIITIAGSIVGDVKYLVQRGRESSSEGDWNAEGQSDSTPVVKDMVTTPSSLEHNTSPEEGSFGGDGVDYGVIQEHLCGVVEAFKALDDVSVSELLQAGVVRRRRVVKELVGKTERLLLYEKLYVGKLDDICEGERSLLTGTSAENDSGDKNET